MSIIEFVDEFLNSDFAKRNLYTHMQMGFPMPVKYREGIAIRFFFHKLVCTREQIILSEPRFEIVLSYPSGRIVFFSEINNKKYSTSEAAIPEKKAERLLYSFERIYDACDDAVDFYNEYHKATGIVYKKYYESLEKVAEDIGLSDWYGGLYDSGSSI